VAGSERPMPVNAGRPTCRPIWPWLRRERAAVTGLTELNAATVPTR
jgi:hypothetical protein